ncbi:HNH endonuclease family protein [Acrocarpospora catenulata]|uniref:HNH endonuclease family protein n=1 Tax=Acrocarpospora catenulata TaxID=2836182 RepID=UPI001BDADA85|nr:HNH endonuclease family protein [Acrocarpospora catenulata]
MTPIWPRSTASVLATIFLLPGVAYPLPANAAPAQLPTPNPLALARAELRQLRVATPRPLSTYERDKFMTEWGHGDNPCDTREIVLLRDARRVRPNADCRVTTGIWYSPYDGRRLTNASQIDVDHLVPLANAWISGANTWSAAKRHAFANDLTRPELVAVSETANLDKGGHSPANWRPPRREYWCTYARAWITVKHHYRLTVTSREKSALYAMLGTCPTP